MDPKALDRLLPRHEVAPMQATLEWDIRRERVKWRREEVTDEGVVLDLSLDGALISAPLDSDHRAGDVVRVRLGGVEGEAKIRHVRVSDDGDARLYGIRFVLTPELQAAVASGVEQVRGNANEVRRTWEDKRR